MGELVGSIPVPALRAMAASEILKPVYQEMPLNRRQAEEHVREKYRRPLSGAQFDQADATLVPVMNDEATGERIGGGACNDCPMRSGNRPELAGDGLKRGDVCLNPKCFAAKSTAHFNRLQESAAAEGKRILTSDEAAATFDEDGSLPFDSDYVLLSKQPDKQEVRSDFTGKLPSWKKLLENVEAKPQIVVARDPKGRVVELVVRRLAIEAINLAAKQKGETSLFESAGARPASSSKASGDEEETSWQRQDRKNREISKLNFQITLAAMSALVGAIDAKGAVKGFWNALIEASITHAGHDGCWLICKRLGLDPKAENGHTTLEGVQGAALEYGLTLPNEELKLGYVVELLLSQRVKFSNSMHSGITLRSEGSFMAFAKLYKIDLGEIEKRVAAEAKEKKKAKGKNAKKLPKPETPAKPALVNPTPRQLEDACSVAEITHGTLHRIVKIEKKDYAVSSITFAPDSPPSFGLVEVIPAGEFIGKTRTHDEPSIGGRHYYFGMLVKHGGKDFVLGKSREYSIGKKRKTARKAPKPKEGSAAGLQTSVSDVAAAEHVFKKVVGNKWRCVGCGAAAVKHQGKLIVAKDFRGKPCSMSEAKSKGHKSKKVKVATSKKKHGLTAAGRKKLAAAMKARWAARRKVSKSKEKNE
jgi:hypothetical protein